MFENISNAAEKLVTNVGESRRGFLVRVGQAALGVTGVVAGLLALPTQVQAIGTINRGCQMDYSGALTGICIDKRSGSCRWCYASDECPVGASGGRSNFYLCAYRISTMRTCRCP